MKSSLQKKLYKFSAKTCAVSIFWGPTVKATFVTSTVGRLLKEIWNILRTAAWFWNESSSKNSPPISSGSWIKPSKKISSMGWPKASSSPAILIIPKLSQKNLGETQLFILRSVVAVFRHGDRTPKQKMKMKVSHKKFIEFYYENYKKGDVHTTIKLKQIKIMEEFLDITKSILFELEQTNETHIVDA